MKRRNLFASKHPRAIERAARRHGHARPLFSEFAANRRRLARSSAGNLTAALSSSPLILDAPRAELARLCRQIWIDHERTPHVSLENDFTSALSEVQAHHPDASLGEDDLWDVVRAEYDHVAQASAVAELLWPRLTALLRERPAAAGRALPTAPTAAAPAVSAPPPRPAVSGVADLIEGMLDLERREARRPSPSHRS